MPHILRVYIYICDTRFMGKNSSLLATPENRQTFMALVKVLDATVGYRPFAWSGEDPADLYRSWWRWRTGKCVPETHRVRQIAEWALSNPKTKEVLRANSTLHASTMKLALALNTEIARQAKRIVGARKADLAALRNARPAMRRWVTSATETRRVGTPESQSSIDHAIERLESWIMEIEAGDETRLIDLYQLALESLQNEPADDQWLESAEEVPDPDVLNRIGRKRRRPRLKRVK
jgi:hypothetical protein